jgi:WD40 repeat protein
MAAEAESKARIFISYSRKDMPFADKLEAALKVRGFEVLIDRQEIYAFEDWWKRIQALIGGADTVVFVLSPDAVKSDVALKEVAHAALLNKRFAPIVCRRVDDAVVPDALRRLNFIFFDDPEQFEASADRLAEALQTDIAWIRQHTEYGEAARRWLAAGRPGGLLLRSPALEGAERWIASRPTQAPTPTQATQAFIVESRRGAVRRTAFRAVLGIVVGILAVGAVIGGWAAWQSGRTAQAEESAGILKGSVSLVPEAAVPRLLEALPRSVRFPNRPYLPEVASQLALSLDRSRDFLWLRPGYANVKSLKFATNAPYLLSSSENSKASAVELWDMSAGGRRIYKFEGSLLYDVDISADGQQIVIAERISQSPLRLIHLQTAEAVQYSETLVRPAGTNDQTFTTASFDRTGRFLAVQAYSSANKYSLLVISLTDGSVIHRWPATDSIVQLAFDQSGRYLVALYPSPENKVDVFDLSLVHLAWSASVPALTMVVDGATLLVGQPSAGTVGFDLATGEPAPGRKIQNQSIIAMSRDRSIVAVRDNYSLLVRPTDNQMTMSKQFIGALGMFGVASMSGDGQLLAIGGNNENIIHLRQSMEDRAPDLSGVLGSTPILTAALSDDGQSLITADRAGKIGLVKTSTASVVGQIDCDCGQPVFASVDPTGVRALLIGSRAALLLKLPELVVENRIHFDAFSVTSATVDRALSVAALQAKGSLHLLYVAEGRIDAIVPDKSELFVPAASWLSDDGSTLAYVSLDGAYVLKLPSKEMVFHRPADGEFFRAAAFDQGGKTLALLEQSGAVVLIDIANRREKLTSQVIAPNVGSIRFIGPDQHRLLVTSQPPVAGPVWLISIENPSQPPTQLSYSASENMFSSDAAVPAGTSGILTSVANIIAGPNYSDATRPVVLWDVSRALPLPIRQFNFYRPNPDAPFRMVVSGNGHSAFLFGEGPVASIVSLEGFEPQALINEACRRVVRPMNRPPRSQQLTADWFSDLVWPRLFFRFDKDVRPESCPSRLPRL